MDFPGVALVIGAASGIGKATAIQYGVDGCQRIAIADIDDNALEAVKKEIKQISRTVNVKALQVDVRNQDSVQALITEVVKEFGRIDYCANVAGVLRYGDTVTLSERDWNFVYEVNLRGIFYCTKAEITQMLTQEPLVSK
jgi:NAD(P)-dependent dehydrogenase (short-subunit alcohol dehydrogenase family)